MSAIFNNAAAVTQGNKLSVMSASSLSGRRIAQRRGPYLYTFEVAINPLSTDSDAYKSIRNEIANMDYGVSALITTIPYLTQENGSWSGTPVVDGADQTGRTITLGGFTQSATNVIMDGDYIQFGNNTKVYQAIGDFDADGSGNVDVYLNSPVVVSPVDASSVVYGTSVEFSLITDEAKFGMGFTPRSVDSNIVKLDNITLTEVVNT
jgi:hypothetical protein